MGNTFCTKLFNDEDDGLANYNHERRLSHAHSRPTQNGIGRRRGQSIMREGIQRGRRQQGAISDLSDFSRNSGETDFD